MRRVLTRLVRRTSCLDSPTVGKKAARYLSALFLAAFLVVPVAGCGTDRSNLLSSETAEGLAAEIDRIETLVAAGDCFAALRRAEEARLEVEGLQGDIDERLRTSLLDGMTQLQLLIQEECETGSVGETVIEEELDEAGSGGSGSQPEGGDEGNGGGSRPRPEPEPEPNPTPNPPDSGGVSPGGVSPTPGGGSG